MLQVLEKLQFSVSSFRQNRCAEWLHNLLDGYRLCRELILRRTDRTEAVKIRPVGYLERLQCLPYEPESSHADWLEICVPVAAIIVNLNSAKLNCVAVSWWGNLSFRGG